ncbi:MAG: nitroreductase family protein, partial [Limnohabitans sp.]
MKELTTAQVSTVIADADSVDAAILSRFSARAFINKPVEKSVLEELLQVAARAPSGTNTQPWKVYVVQGATKDKLVNEVCAVHNAMASNPALASEYAESYDYYPTQWVSPFIDRRRECGFGLYGVLGIGKGDKEKMHLQHQQNYRFFGAPVGLIFTIDKVMGRG